MKYLNLDESTNVGGHPFSLDDLKYLQDGIFNAVEALAFIHGNGGDPALMSDLQVTDNGATFNINKPAVVYYSGKLYRIEPEFNVAKTIASGSAYKMQLVTVAHSSNPVTYESGNQLNVHKNEYMKLVYTNLTGSDYIPLANFTGSAWRPYTPTVTYMTYAGGGERLNVRYRVEGRTMYLSIDFIGQFDSTGAPSITLPYDYKFFGNGGTLLAGTTPSPGGGGLENVIRALWTENTNVLQFGESDAGGLTSGSGAIHDTLVFEIA